MSSTSSVVTIGSLIKKDLKEAYFLLQQPSSYSKACRFFNDTKYRVYDCPPLQMTHSQCLNPFRNLAAAGNEVPILLEHTPPTYLQDHWRKLLPAFPKANFKSVDEGLQNDVPIVTTAAMECIPEAKHSIHPDIMYEVQLKSSILDIGVSCPRHLNEGSIDSYPCVVKLDMAWAGRGNHLVKNENELLDTLRKVRDESGWTGGIVLQEFIHGVKEVPGCTFHLHKSGEIFWIGTSMGEFDEFEWALSTVDWDMQEHYKELLFEDFTLPIADYLKKRGFFGLVSFEVVITDQGKYLVDLNPRVGADTTYLLLARHMANEVGLKHSAMFSQNKHNFTAQELVAKANDFSNNNNNNNNNQGLAIVLSVVDMENSCCESEIAVFAETPEAVKDIFQKLVN